MATHAGTRGWGNPDSPVYRKKIRSIKVDGAQFNIHKDVAPIFEHFLGRLVTENDYSLDEVYDDWSYILRPIRGYEDEYERTGDMRYLSNHSWGLAIDVNATKNPMSRKLITDLPVGWVKDNIGRYKLAWGGSYIGRKDPMHFEFIGTPKDARAIIDSLNAREDNDLTPEQAKMLKENNEMLKALTAPRRTDRKDADPNALSLADLYTLQEKTYTKVK